MSDAREIGNCSYFRKDDKLESKKTILGLRYSLADNQLGLEVVFICKQWIFIDELSCGYTELKTTHLTIRLRSTFRAQQTDQIVRVPKLTYVVAGLACYLCLLLAIVTFLQS